MGILNFFINRMTVVQAYICAKHYQVKLLSLEFMGDVFVLVMFGWWPHRNESSTAIFPIL